MTPPGPTLTGAPPAPGRPPAQVAARMAHPALAGFRDPVRAWVAESFEAPTPVQALAWPVLARGESALGLAPTGSGKTLAAFLVALDRLLFDPDPAGRCRVVYVSPLKALAVDVERNLRVPLAGIVRWAEALGVPYRVPAIAVRTGDTPARERARFARAPADILITTPESLFLLLTSGARAALHDVETVIVDEVHALIGGKRGAHLALSLERLEAHAGRRLQRVGLSATLRPVAEGARYLGGFADGAPRPVAIVDSTGPKALDLRVEVPVEDMARPVEPAPTPGAAGGERPTSLWPAMHPLILDLVRSHRSTLIFSNSRRLAERLASALNELAGETVAHAHHGSIAREQREVIEARLKAGDLPALVATSSLELGIDMGAIDLVIHVEAPPSVGTALQRIGRAGHTIGAPSAGVILPKYRGDLLACAALTARMLAGDVEPLAYPRNPLDVLAQQIVGMVAMEDWTVEALERLVRRAAPFAELPTPALHGVLDMLSGRYPSDEFAELRPRVTWDRAVGLLSAREGARRVAIANAGTIPDRGLYPVFVAGAPPGKARVGELDEEMVFESREGETFTLGASTWRIEEIAHDRVLVSPAPGVPGKMPFWHGDRTGRTLEFGRAIGALARTLREVPEAEGMARLTGPHRLSEAAARNLLQYLADQDQAAGVVPDDRTLVVERYKDEFGDWRLCLLSPFGSRIHAPWAMAITALARARNEADHDVLWTDDGIVARFPDTDEPPPAEAMLPDPDEVEGLVLAALGTGGGAREAGLGAKPVALFASRFREAAGRALLLPRRRPGQRMPLWQQRKRAVDLLAVAARYDTFPIVLETYRECLRDVFDMPALAGVLRDVRARRIRVVTVDSRAPSPFAAALLFGYVGNFLYEGDSPLAERRAQALTVDPAQLRALLGGVELRDLLDQGEIDEVERALQHLAPERAVRSADGLHDLLLRLGDLTDAEVAERAAPREAAAGWIAALASAGRIAALPVAGERRLVAAEDVGRYRDALGIAPPPGTPPAFLESVRDPLGDLVSRYARTHGPFPARDAAARLGAGVPAVTAALERLAADGRVVEGELRPGGSGREWCDAGVLRAVRRRSLARLRREVEPVEAPALARLAADWQGVGSSRRGRHALLEVVGQLQDAALPASALETEILPARLGRYDPADLDALMAAGAVVWVGAGALGPRDGRLRLYLAERAGDFLDSGPEPPESALARRILQHLAARGASFFPQIVHGVAHDGRTGFVPDLVAAMWDLAWAGLITNDTLQPVRALLGRAARRDRRPGRRPPARRVAPAGVAVGAGGWPAEVAGRWSLVAGPGARAASPAERMTARARQLLERHGVLTREAAMAEGATGGFSAVYPALRAMEDAGRIRRGYFVAGQGPSQFALAGAVERLRALRDAGGEPRAFRLAATDPANPYGAALPWPERQEGRRPMRAAGALVVLVDGALAAWMSARERQLLTFLDAVPGRDPDTVAREVARALAREPEITGQPILIAEVDGRPIADTPMARPLEQAGFHPTPHGHRGQAPRCFVAEGVRPRGAAPRGGGAPV